MSATTKNAYQLHARPTTLAALIADIETDEAAQLDTLETLRESLFGNIGKEEGEMLIEAEHLQV